MHILTLAIKLPLWLRMATSTTPIDAIMAVEGWILSTTLLMKLFFWTFFLSNIIIVESVNGWRIIARTCRQTSMSRLPQCGQGITSLSTWRNGELRRTLCRCLWYVTFQCLITYFLLQMQNSAEEFYICERSWRRTEPAGGEAGDDAQLHDGRARRSFQRACLPHNWRK